MKKIISTFYILLCHTALYFTGVLSFFWLFMNDGNNKYISYDNITMFLEFSLIFGVSSLIDYIPKLPTVLKAFLRFVVNTVSFVFFFVVSTEGSQTGKFISAILFVVVYVVITALCFIIKKLTADKIQEPEEN